MRKFLEIMAIIILFIISLFIFWAGFFPKTFVSSIQKYPALSRTAIQFGILIPQINILDYATSSEPIKSQNGQVIIKNNVWNVEIVSDSVGQNEGLSNRKILYNKTGMLFAFEQMIQHFFWMKDMLFPIDIIFFDNNWQIILIESNLQPNTYPKIFGSGVDSQYVLEINAGEADFYDFQIGDHAIFLNK